MPRLDLVLALIRAGSSADIAGVRAASEAIANEEDQRGHHNAATRLRNALGGAVFQGGGLSPTPEPADGLLIELPTRSGLDALELEDRSRSDLSALVREQRNTRKLEAKGLFPRHKVLLSGPPGNGKTSVAEALAYDLGLRFMVVSYGALIGSLLGETNRRIEHLFAQAASGPCVLFFDEFEAVGKERADRQEAGEMKRALASLLTKIDTLPSSVVVVAATNHPEMLDRAVWRRFEIKLVLNPPNYSRVIGYLISQLGLQPDLRLIQTLGECFPSTSYAELRDFTLDVRRRAVLDSTDTLQALRAETLGRFPEIDWPIDDNRSDQAVAAPKSTKKRRKAGGSNEEDPR